MGDLMDFFDPRKPLNKVVLKVTLLSPKSEPTYIIVISSVRPPTLAGFA